MSKRFVFFGRQKEVEQVRALYAKRRHVLVVGAAGLGKTALLQHVGKLSPILICDDSSSLRRICDSLERQLGCARCKLNVIERKNRLLIDLELRGEPVAFDHVIHTAPRVARFMAHLGEKIPIWIACRSDRPNDVGHIWAELYNFARIELFPLTKIETLMLIDEAVARGNIQANARAHGSELHRISGGSPRILAELLVQLAAREYNVDSSLGLHLLDLDRRIHQLGLSIKATAEAQK
jgi:hypothetical protein